ncbi:hypothetical protein ACFE04_027469 [Oxalis oulophora]
MNSDDSSSNNSTSLLSLSNDSMEVNDCTITLVPLVVVLLVCVKRVSSSYKDGGEPRGRPQVGRYGAGERLTLERMSKYQSFSTNSRLRVIESPSLRTKISSCTG